MKKILGQIARALYQLVVVDIICLPYRLGCLIASILRGFIAASEGVSFRLHMRYIMHKIKADYTTRAYWVRYGSKSN